MNFLLDKMISIRVKKKIAQVECQQGREWAHYTLAYRLIKLQSCFIDTKTCALRPCLSWSYTLESFQ